MKGLVILDGPDAVGKTTLARELLKASGDKIVKCADGDEYSGYVHLQYYPDKELWRLQYYTLIKAAWRYRAACSQ
jgi:tRNA uridine 5-carbamoylmethylation protein Kti12